MEKEEGREAKQLPCGPNSWKSAYSLAGQLPTSGCLSSPCGIVAPSQPAGLHPIPVLLRPAPWKGPLGYFAHD